MGGMNKVTALLGEIPELDARRILEITSSIGKEEASAFLTDIFDQMGDGIPHDVHQAFHSALASTQDAEYV